MRRPMSASLVAVFLLLFVLASWAAVAVEYAVSGQMTLVTLAPALMFTSLLVLWPFSSGLRVTAQGLQQSLSCHQCGALRLPEPRIRFCIRCGAYPKPLPTPA